jgi:hypothetical protein
MAIAQGPQTFIESPALYLASSWRIVPFTVSGHLSTYLEPQYLRDVPINKISETSACWVNDWRKFGDEIIYLRAKTATDKERLLVKETELENFRGTTAGDRIEKDKERVKVEHKANQSENHVMSALRLSKWIDCLGIHPNQLFSKEYICGTGLINPRVLQNLEYAIKSIESKRIEFEIQLNPFDLLRHLYVQALKNVSRKW